MFFAAYINVSVRIRLIGVLLAEFFFILAEIALKNNIERKILIEKCEKINDERARSIKKIFVDNLELKYEMSNMRRGKEEGKVDVNNAAVIQTLFDRELTLIGYYEACLTKKINEDNFKNKIRNLSIFYDSAEAKNIANKTQRLSQTAILPNIMTTQSKEKSSVSQSDKNTKVSEILTEDSLNSNFNNTRRKSSFHPQYMLTITKGAVKRHKSIIEIPTKFRVAKQKKLINRIPSKEY